MLRIECIFQRGSASPEKMVKLYVSKLTAEVTGENLRTLFEQCGTVETAERVRNKEIGFVHMPNEKEAFQAVR